MQKISKHVSWSNNYKSLELTCLLLPIGLRTTNKQMNATLLGELDSFPGQGRDNINIKNCSLILHHQIQRKTSLINVKCDKYPRLKSYNDFLKKIRPVCSECPQTSQPLKFFMFDINQICSSLKSMMQYCGTFFCFSVIFIVKNDIQYQVWPKKAFYWPKEIPSSEIVESAQQESRVDSCYIMLHGRALAS